MSAEAVVWAWQQPVRGTAKLILLALADHADQLGQAWISRKDLGERCGVRSTQVTAHIHTLRDLGLVLSHDRVAESGRRVANLYEVTFYDDRDRTGPAGKPPGGPTGKSAWNRAGKPVQAGNPASRHTGKPAAFCAGNPAQAEIFVGGPAGISAGEEAPSLSLSSSVCIDTTTPTTSSCDKSAGRRRRLCPATDAPDVVEWIPITGVLPGKANRFGAPMRQSEASGWEYGVREAEVEELQAAFPAVDVRQKLRALRQWSLNNAKRRKTYSRFAAWLSSRCAVDQDRGVPASVVRFPSSQPAPAEQLPNAYDVIAERDRRRRTGEDCVPNPAYAEAERAFRAAKRERGQ